MRCRSTSAHVGCTTKTSVPRMFSSIWNETSVSGNRCSRACPTGTPRNSAISSVSARMRAAGEDFQLSAEPSSPAVAPVSDHRQPPPGSSSGWGGRIRTSEYGIQSPAPYRLATPHRRSARPLARSTVGHASSNRAHHRRDPLARPQKVKSTGLGRRAIGRGRGARARRGVSVRVSSARAPLRDSGLTARSAAARLRNRPKTAEPLPDIAAATAPASCSCGLQRADLRVTPDDRRLEVVDHLRRAARPGHRQQLELARLPQPGRAVLVVPGVRLGGRHAERRPDDRRSSAAADRRADRSPRRARARARCRRTGRTGRRRRSSRRLRASSVSGAPPHRRASARARPPRPRCRRRARPPRESSCRSSTIVSRTSPARPSAVHSAAAAFQTRLLASSGTPARAALQRERPRTFGARRACRAARSSGTRSAARDSRRAACRARADRD